MNAVRPYIFIEIIFEWMYLKWINLKNQDNLPSLWTDTEYWIEWMAFNECWIKIFLSVSPGSWAIAVLIYHNSIWSNILKKESNYKY